MDGEEILMGLLGIIFIIALVILIVLMPLNAYFDSDANTQCRLAGYGDGYRTGLVFGDNICSNIVQEEVIEYFRLE